MKNLIAIAVVAVIVGSCIMIASAQFVVWNVNETKAVAKTIDTAPAGI